MASKNIVERKKQSSRAPGGRTNPASAGIDLGSTVHYVAVPADRDSEPVRHFGTMTGDLNALADWLVGCKLETVAMEATGVYWVPIFQILESRGIEVCLVNARHVKNVPGRKSDVQDCQWLQYLHSVGLLNGSFRPPAEVVALRCLIRHREGLSRTACQHLLRLQKSLDQMNVLLHRVVTDITGVTGLAILDAIVGGERDPKVLANLRDKRCKHSVDQIAAALEGDWREEHLFTLRQSLEAWRYHQELIADCNRQIDCQMAALRDNSEGAPPPAATKPCADEPMRQQLFEKLGVDLTAVPGVSVKTALAVVSEVGADMSKFPTAAHFASWLTLCPDNRITGGKTHGAHTRQSNIRLAASLRMAAQTLLRSESPLGDWFRRIRAKLGGRAATVAGAHKLARILYSMIKHRTPYDAARTEPSPFQRLRKENHLRKQAEKLGFQLVPADLQPA